MASDNKVYEIQDYKKKWQFNIGIIIFGVIFVYLVITILLYLTTKHVTPYEVRQGSIVKDNAYTGIALRNETVVNTDSNGFINYYVTEGSKVKLASNIYTLSPQKQEEEAVSADAARELTSEESHSLLLKVQKFNENFDGAHFDSLYSFKSDISNSLQNISNQSKMDQLNQKIAEGTEGLSLYPTTDDGIVLYYVDQMETLTINDLTKESFKRENYKRTDIHSNDELAAGSPAYKLVTSENWMIAVVLSEESAKQLTDTTDVRVHFLKDDELAWADFSLVEQDGMFLGCLSFDNSMIRYATERFVDLEIIFEDESGLKIPKTSVTEKDFYVVPEEYLTKGGNNKESGVLVRTTNSKGEDNTTFQAAEIYYTIDGNAYLEPSLFESGSVAVRPDSHDTHPIKEKKKLKGVYNINKGYAVFKQINILCESDEYYIVEEGNSYGLSNFDHIALDGSAVKENEIIAK